MSSTSRRTSSRQPRSRPAVRLAGTPRGRLPPPDEPADAAHRGDAVDRLRAARGRGRAAHLRAPSRDAAPLAPRRRRASTRSLPIRPTSARSSAIRSSAPATADHASLGESSLASRPRSSRDDRLLQMDERPGRAQSGPATPKLTQALLQEGVGRAVRRCRCSCGSSPGTGSSGGSRTRCRAASGGTRRARAGGSSTTTSRSR